MIQSEFYQMLKTSGYPVAFNEFKIAPTIPFIVYLKVTNNTFFADGKVHFKSPAYRVELYTSAKDYAAENALEATFDSHSLCYEKDRVFIESESLYQTTYEIGGI